MTVSLPLVIEAGIKNIKRYSNLNLLESQELFKI